MSTTSTDHLNNKPGALVVTITGAAGRIAYSLIPLLLSGNIFGPLRGIHLRLLDIPESSNKLRGVQMEIEDSYYPLLKSLVATDNQRDAFQDCEVAILIGGYPRLPGMERRDLLIKNAQSIRSQALALNEFGRCDAKVLVVANPANTNCLVAIKTATKIPKENFTCLTRLDQERLRGFCAKHLSVALEKTVTSHQVHNVYILGNHSTTQVAYIQEGHFVDSNGTKINLEGHMSDEAYMQILKKVQNRGAEIINTLQVSSALSAAEAIVCHLRDWLGPEIPQYPFSMGILSNGNEHCIPEELVYSLPCVRAENAHGYEIARGFTFGEKTLNLMEATSRELLNERSQIEDYIK